MSNLNEQDVALAASKRLKKGAEAIPTLMTYIPNALSNLARQVANQPYRRRLLVTDQASATVNVTNATYNYYADLSTLQTTPGIMLEYLQLGTIFYVNAVKTWATTAVSPGECVSVYGGGTGSVTAAYNARGTEELKPYYNVIGQAGSINTYAIVWPGVAWTVNDSAGFEVYYSNDDVAYPWLVTTWLLGTGVAPAPTVKQTTDSIIIVGHGYNTGLAVRLTTGGTLPVPLNVGVTYYIIKVDDDVIQLATTIENAGNGVAIELQDIGTGTGTVTPYGKTVVQWLGSANQGELDQAIDFYTYVWLEQNLLYTNAKNGSFAFAVPFTPTLSSLPSQLENDVVDGVVQLALTAGFLPLTEAVR